MTGASGLIYSVGYEGVTVDAFIERLTSVDVSLVVDVRLSPWSRKPGFSRKPLAAALDGAGIAYSHEPDLGNPVDNRDSFRQGDGEEGRRRMRHLLENESAPAVQRLIAHARAGRVAVLCLERDRRRCHRNVITELVEEIDPMIEVVEL